MTRTRKKADADGPTNLNGKVQPDARMIVLATGSTVDAAADPVVDATHGASAVDQETEPVAGSVARAMVVDHPLSPPAADAYGLSDPPGPSDLGGPADLFDPGDADDPGDAGDADDPDDPGVDMSDYRGFSLIAGLRAPTAAIGPPRRVLGHTAWARSMRRFARATVWAVPAAAICFALGGLWGWPTPDEGPTGQSAGTWLVVTLLGLLFGLLGAVSLTALLAATTGRRWALIALLFVAAGTVFFAPVVGLVGLARPSVTSIAGQISRDAATNLEAAFFDGSVGRWLGIGGLVLLAAGWLALGCAVIASGVLHRVDGWLVLVAVAVAVGAAYLSWQVVFVIGSMLLLAAGLGLAWSASRLTLDGRSPDDY